MARSYRRDARGRFAGGGGGSGGRRGTKLPAPAARKVGSAPQRRRGLLIQRAAVKSTKAKLAAKDPADRTIKGQLSRRSQKGAVTKASKALQAAQQSGRVRLSGRSGVLRPGRNGSGAKPAATVATKARVRVTRPANRLAKPAGLAPGAIERRTLDRASRDYRTIDARAGRANANARRLRGQLSMAEMRRDQNPYPKGKAAARKERTRRQSAVDGIQKRLDKQYAAQVTYGQRRQMVDAKLTAVGRARTGWAAVPRASRRGATYQRNLLGGSDAAYRG